MKEFFKPNLFKIIFSFILAGFVVYQIFFDSTNSKGAEPNTFYLLLWPFIWPAMLIFMLWAAIEPGIADIPHRVGTLELLIALSVNLFYLYFLSSLIFWFKKRILK